MLVSAHFKLGRIVDKGIPKYPLPYRKHLKSVREEGSFALAVFKRDALWFFRDVSSRLKLPHHAKYDGPCSKSSGHSAADRIKLHKLHQLRQLDNITSFLPSP